jgi:hypothetical protein
MSLEKKKKTRTDNYLSVCENSNWRTIKKANAHDEMNTEKQRVVRGGCGKDEWQKGEKKGQSKQGSAGGNGTPSWGAIAS